MYMYICICICICIYYIPLDPCDYLKKISIKINMVPDEGNSRN